MRPSEPMWNWPNPVPALNADTTPIKARAGTEICAGMVTLGGVAPQLKLP
ncbi:hypothetical protein GCM10008965_37490 [Methylorubrum aminovorans]